MAKIQNLRWYGAGASVPGPYHDRSPELCEDAWRCLTKQNFLVAVVCDGAGSAKYARRAARLTVSSLACSLYRNIRTRQSAASSPPEDVSSLWRDEVFQCLNSTRNCLIAEAQRENQDIYDYLCTVVGVVADINQGLFFHIGDGAAGATDDATFESDEHVISPPENGDTPSEAFFLIEEEWQKHTRFTPFFGKTSVIIVSDGITTSLFTKKYQRLEKAFYLPVKQHLDQMGGRALRSKSLQAILSQPSAEEISSGHDDKTIVWAYLK